MAALPILQHYVPQFLLRHFAAGDKQLIHVLDKRDSRTFASPVSKVGGQRGFYNVPRDTTKELLDQARSEGLDVETLGDIVISLEPALGRVENDAALVVERIVKDESIAGLDQHDRETLALFAAVQYVRVPRQRALHTKVVEAMRRSVSPFVEGDAEAAYARLGLALPTPAERANMHLHHLTLAPAYVPYFLEKTWFLERAPTDDPFCISDNPVTLWNYGPHGESGAYGIGTLGSEIALPLTPRYCLVMLCSSFLANIRGELQMLERLQAKGLALDPPETTRLDNFVEAADKGVPLDLDASNVTHFNWRQIYNASRYVYASDPRFALTRQVLQEEPETRFEPGVVTDHDR